MNDKHECDIQSFSLLQIHQHRVILTGKQYMYSLLPPLLADAEVAKLSLQVPNVKLQC